MNKHMVTDARVYRYFTLYHSILDEVITDIYAQTSFCFSQTVGRERGRETHRISSKSAMQ